MALSDKNILITPNIGASADPTIVLSGADATTAAQNISLTMYPTSNGTLSFEGSAGQLLSVTNNLSTGTIFSVNDISGMPSLSIDASGAIDIAPYGGSTKFNGSSYFTGAYPETTGTAGVYAGIVNSTPRVGFFNGTAAQNWQIDNDGTGAFRWYTPGVTRMQLTAADGLRQNNTTSGFGAVPSEYTYRLAANLTAFGPAIGNFFGASSAINLEAASVYELTAYCVFTKTTAGTATFTLTASSAPTRMFGTYRASNAAGITSVLTPQNGAGGAQAATACAMTASASLTTAVNHGFQIKAQIHTNAACNIRINLTQSAGTATPLAGSYYTIKDISTSTGTFAA